MEEKTSKSKKRGRNNHRAHHKNVKLSFVECDQVSITLAWLSPNSNFSYQLQYINVNKRETWDHCRVLKIMSGAEDYQVSVTQLAPSQTYTFRLQVVDQNGTLKGEPGPECTIDTQGACCIMYFNGMNSKLNCAMKCMTFETGLGGEKEEDHKDAHCSQASTSFDDLPLLTEPVVSPTPLVSPRLRDVSQSSAISGGRGVFKF
mmetsp:Transcript_8356/g.10978  ORF Transcript_8356/g.10978 Transcript_8356/m.10978 type:complete len:203 (+) Transcript_8356:74-682(+)